MAESTGGIRRGGPRRPRPRSSSAPCPAYRSENAQTSAGKGGTSDQLTRPVGNTISTDGAENAPTVAAAPVIVKDRLVRAPTVSQAAAQLTVRTAENSQAILPVLAPSLGANRTMGIPEQSNGITDSSPRRRSPVFLRRSVVAERYFVFQDEAARDLIRAMDIFGVIGSADSGCLLKNRRPEAEEMGIWRIGSENGMFRLISDRYL